MKINNKKNKGDFYYPKNYPTRLVAWVRFQFWLKSIGRWLRVQKPITQVFGHQYIPSNDLIEIDLTYLCNLRCNNCNRSSAQAPGTDHIDIEMIQSFVEQSLSTNRQWRRIRVLGGEPTLHPDFLDIIDTLLKLKVESPATRIEIVSNGYGNRVNSILAQLPETIEIENSAKSENVQPNFGPFNLAPVDSWQYKYTDFGNGCDITRSCGIGLTPQGYYPCAVAGGIDRVLGLNRGRSSIPPTDDEMRDLLAENCKLCGRFRDGHYVPDKLRKPILTQQTSKSWDIIYSDWQQRESRDNDEAQ